MSTDIKMHTKILISQYQQYIKRLVHPQCVVHKTFENQSNWGFPGGSVVKNLPANAGDAGDASSIPGSGRYPGVGKRFPLQYSCLENSMDRKAWWAIVSWGHK